MLYVVVVPTVQAEATAIGRLLTSAELAFCRSRQRVEEHVAARLAAKQAVLTALQSPAELVEAVGRDVELVRDAGGRPGVRLRGAVERSRIARGLGVPGVSLSHAAGFAAALSWLPGGCPSPGSGPSTLRQAQGT